MKKILIIVGGNKNKIDEFLSAGQKLDLDVRTASFSDLSYESNDSLDGINLKVSGETIDDIDVVYIRMVGKRLEDVTVLANYCKEKGIKIVDSLYADSLLLPSSISKAMELKKMIVAGIPVPPVLYGSLVEIKKRAPAKFGFPFVIKSTSGKKARDVWSPDNESQLEDLIKELKTREKEGTRFFAQQFVKASQRVRVLVIGGAAVAGVTRPTKWRKRFIEKVNGEFPEGKKAAIYPVPEKYAKLSESAAKAANLEVSGIDILEEDGSNKLWIIEANAAPSWNLIKKDTGLLVEEEILKFLASL